MRHWRIRRIPFSFCRIGFVWENLRQWITYPAFCRKWMNLTWMITYGPFILTASRYLRYLSSFQFPDNTMDWRKCGRESWIFWSTQYYLNLWSRCICAATCLWRTWLRMRNLQRNICLALPWFWKKGFTFTLSMTWSGLWRTWCWGWKTGFLFIWPGRFPRIIWRGFRTRSTAISITPQVRRQWQGTALADTMTPPTIIWPAAGKRWRSAGKTQNICWKRHIFWWKFTGRKKEKVFSISWKRTVTWRAGAEGFWQHRRCL